jgi:O-Antigen ligase
MPRRKPRPPIRIEPASVVTEPEGLLADVQSEAAALGEMFRRVALGLTAALVVVRSYWPAEYGIEEKSGSGLFWSMLMIVAAIIAVTGMWLEGGLRLRRSWADLGVASLIILVGISATHAAEKRIAINFAWEWVAVGVAYLLLRNLPRTRGEASAIAAALMAAAIALAAYAMYQIVFEFPGQRALFLANPREALLRHGMDPNIGPQQMARFEDRLVGSREPIATFALANTLAGFLVGPMAVALVMALRGLTRRENWKAVALAAPLGLLLLVCLMLTKSRSAYLGLLAAMVGLAWIERRRVSLKRLALVGIGSSVVIAILVGVATRLGQLDKQVLTQSFKSLAYRWEYWQGAWSTIIDGRFRWLVGLGPGNFGSAYLGHKLPWASEGIQDPHNLFLEVWATAGLPALLALIVGLGFGLRECFAAGNLKVRAVEPDPEIESQAPASVAWLVIAAGLGAWLLVVALGHVSAFEPDPTGRRMNVGLSARWLILGAAWVAAVILGRPFWTRLAVSPDALGLGALAIAVNLLAAGGIAYAPVALMLWGLLGLGQDLREDRRCGERKAVGGRALAFAPAALLAALTGTFFGTALPFFKGDSAITRAKEARKGPAPDVDLAAQAYREAVAADPLSARGWIGWAELEFENWRAHPTAPFAFTWLAIDSKLKHALKPPLNPRSLVVHIHRMGMARVFLDGPELSSIERTRIRKDLLVSCTAACALYPTNATFRVELAEALAEVDKFEDAIEQGRRARDLDDAMPHEDKKILPEIRARLNAEMPIWSAKVRSQSR